MQNKLVCLIYRKAKEALFLALQQSKANNVLFISVFGRARASELKAGWCEHLTMTVLLALFASSPSLEELAAYPAKLKGLLTASKSPPN